MFPRARLAYCDLTIATDDGQDWPIAFPSFDYERMLEQGYCAYVFAMPMASAREAADAGAGNLFRLANAALDHRRSADRSNADIEAGAAPVHVPGFLARIPPLDLGDGSMQLALATDLHLRARGVAAAIEPSGGGSFPSVHVRRGGPKAKVSIVIPTRDRADLLRPCLELLKRTMALKDNELIIIDNDSSDPDALDCLQAEAEQGARLVHIRGPYNFARLIGSAAAMATGEFLLVMNNDVEAVSEDWLEDMLSRAAEPDVGAVGATLLWPSGVVRHGGVVLGMRLAAGSASDDRIDGDPGYSDQLVVAHQRSAVSGACLLTRRSLFGALNGFDGVRFPADYADIDYCLRLRARGYRVVMAPRARLLRHGSAAPRTHSGDRRRQPNTIGSPEFARRMGRGPVERSLLQSDAVNARQPVFGPRLPAAILRPAPASRRSSTTGPPWVLSARRRSFGRRAILSARHSFQSFRRDFLQLPRRLPGPGRPP